MTVSGKRVGHARELRLRELVADWVVETLVVMSNITRFF